MLPELDVTRVQRWCAARVPEHARHQVRVECEIGRSALTGTSSKQQALVSRLAATQPALMATSVDHGQDSPVRKRQAQRRLTAEQAQQLAAEYEDGVSVQDLAVRWDVHRTTVAARLRQAGVQLAAKACPPTAGPRPSGSTVGAGPASDWPSATAATPRRCGSCSSRLASGYERRGSDDQKPDRALI